MLVLEIPSHDELLHDPIVHSAAESVSEVSSGSSLRIVLTFLDVDVTDPEQSFGIEVESAVRNNVSRPDEE